MNLQERDGASRPILMRVPNGSILIVEDEAKVAEAVREGYSGPQKLDRWLS
jgi:hypothetical protein